MADRGRIWTTDHAGNTSASRRAQLTRIPPRLCRSARWEDPNARIIITTIQKLSASSSQERRKHPAYDAQRGGDLRRVRSRSQFGATCTPAIYGGRSSATPPHLGFTGTPISCRRTRTTGNLAETHHAAGLSATAAVPQVRRSSMPSTLAPLLLLLLPFRIDHINTGHTACRHQDISRAGHRHRRAAVSAGAHHTDRWLNPAKTF